MENIISINDTGDKFMISLDKSAFDKKTVFDFLERLRVEYLARTTDPELSDLSEDIKAEWWNKNKQRFLK